MYRQTTHSGLTVPKLDLLDLKYTGLPPVTRHPSNYAAVGGRDEQILPPIFGHA
jgi:hypothetical protein